MPCFDTKLELRPEGVLFLKARILHNWVSSYTGQQLSNVHAMHTNMFKLEAAEQAVPFKIDDACGET